MADNYIERQYEKYQERKAAWEKAKKLGKKKPVRRTVTPPAISSLENQEAKKQPEPSEDNSGESIKG